ncbi:hypothetical protein H5410_004805, partial [Solanum commersonii]
MLTALRNACSNIVPTPKELATFDLPKDEHVPPSSHPTTSVNPKIVQSNDIAVFDEFSSKPPEQLLRRSSRVSDTSSPPPPKRRIKWDTPKTKVSEPSKPNQSNVSLNQPFSISDGPPTPATNVHDSADAQKVNYVIPDIEELKDHLKNYVDKKFEELVILIKENHSQLMRSRHKEINNVDPQSSNKQPSPHIQIDLADIVGVADCEVGVSVNEGGHQVNVNAEDDEAQQAPQDLNEVIMDEDGDDTVQHNIRHFVPDKITVDTLDSSTSTTISPSTQVAIDAPISDLGKVPIPAKPLCVYNPQDLTDSHDLLSD